MTTAVSKLPSLPEDSFFSKLKAEIVQYKDINDEPMGYSDGYRGTLKTNWGYGNHYECDYYDFHESIYEWEKIIDILKDMVNGNEKFILEIIPESPPDKKRSSRKESVDAFLQDLASHYFGFF